MAFFTTFYSFKGGVGRSLALANVAWDLVSQGRSVLILDMDFEAPSHYAFFDLEPPEDASSGGLAGLATAYSETGEVPGPITPWTRKSRNAPGSLHVLAAGQRHPEYASRISALNWLSLHPKLGTQPFLDALREAIESELNPDYVLIDSRTGFSEVGGVCTHLMADHVVLLSNLSLPCLDGTVRVYRSIWESGRADVPEGPVLVMTPVPPGTLNSPVVKERVRQAEEVMPRAGKVLAIRYESDMVLAEELAVQRDEDDVGRFAAETVYHDLRERIQRANRADPFAAEEQSAKLSSKGQHEQAIRVLQAFVSAHEGSVHAWKALGTKLLALGREVEARDALQKTTELAPWDTEAWRALGTAAAVGADEQHGEVVAEWYRQAVTAYKRAMEDGELDGVEFANLGAVLTDLAFWAEGAAKVSLLQESMRWAGKAIELDEELAWVRSNLGVTKLRLADTLKGPSRRRALVEAVDWMRRSLDIDPSHFKARRNYVHGLVQLANTYEGRERLRLLKKALKVVIESVEVPGADLGALLAERVEILSQLSRYTEGQERSRWARRAVDLVTSDSGVTRMDVAKRDKVASSLLKLWWVAPELEELLQIVVDVCRDVPSESAHVTSYNLACAFSLLEEHKAAQDALHIALDFDPEFRTHALQDPDLKNLFAANPALKAEIEASLAETPSEPAQ